MKALITKSSDIHYEKIIEIKSLDDLMKIGETESIIIDFHPSHWGCDKDFDIIIEIYDCLREIL